MHADGHYALAIRSEVTKCCQSAGWPSACMCMTTRGSKSHEIHKSNGNSRRRLIVRNDDTRLRPARRTGRQRKRPARRSREASNSQQRNRSHGRRAAPAATATAAATGATCPAAASKAQQPQRLQQPQQHTTTASAQPSPGNSAQRSAAPARSSNPGNKRSRSGRANRRKRGSNSGGWLQKGGWQGHVLAAKSRPALGLRPSQLGTARRLRRLLRASDQLQSLFRQPALLPYQLSPGYLSWGIRVSATAGIRS